MSASCSNRLIDFAADDALSPANDNRFGIVSSSDAGDLLTLNHNFGGTVGDVGYTFTYTPAHQLASEAINNSRYLWQPPVTDSTTAYVPNNLNQYATVGAASFAYDGNGNLTSDGTFAYGYDAENRLLTASKTGVAASYVYDPLGRRTHKSGTGVTETFFADSGSDEIEELDATGALARRIIPGPAIDEPIAMINTTGFYYYFHANAQGSIVALSTTGGGVPGGVTALYDPYGNCFVVTTPCGGPGGPYRFTGQRLDTETGLLYYRARYYSSALGRFLQVDPVGYTADMDLYTYVGNDPTDKEDPTGREAVNELQRIDPSFGGSPNNPDPPPNLNNIAAAVDFGSAIAALAEIDTIAGAPAAVPTEAGGHALANEVRAATQLEKNVAQGAAGEAKTAAKLGDKVAAKQVTFKTNDGTRTRADFVTTDKSVVETKTGPRGDLSTGQQKLHNDINAGRQVTPVGQNAAKAGLTPGEPTTMKSCSVDRPC